MQEGIKRKENSKYVGKSTLRLYKRKIILLWKPTQTNTIPNLFTYYILFLK